jgi:formylglycine-generating enzyme
MGERRRRSRRRCLRAAVLLLFLSLGIGCSTPPATQHEEEDDLALRAVATTVPVALASRPRSAACPAGMLLVDGRYCPEPVHVCERWLDPPGRYHDFRCAEYAQPARCDAPRTRLRFCIDRDEYAKPGNPLPANHQSLVLAERTCAALGKRVCREREWVFACEGEELRPYPYGFRRDAGACNADRTPIVDSSGKLLDLRVGSEEFPGCTSPFGVRHQAGNLEELVALDATAPPRAALKGAYWQPGRNTCRAVQTAHDAHYSGVETGFRCCADADQ